MSLSRSLVLPALFIASVAVAQHREFAPRPILPGSPRLTAELPVSGITYDRGYSGTHPRIASGPDQALVIWSNGAVRVDQNGAPLDVLPLLHSSGYPEGLHDVAWNGSSYTVATTRFDGTDLIISLVDITTDGDVLPRRDIERVTNPNVSVAIGINGNRTVVAYSVRNNDASFDEIALLLQDGVVVQRITLAKNDLWSFPGRVIASPSGFLVLWSRNYRLIDLNGNVIAGTLSQSSVDAVWNENAFVMAASDADALTLYSILPNGAKGPTTVVHAAEPNAGVASPSIAWNGTEYAVLWQKVLRAGYSGGSYDLYATRVSPSFAVLSETLLKKSIWYSDFRFVPPADSDSIAAIHSAFIPVWGSGIPTTGGGVRTIYASNLDEFERSTQLLSRAASAQQALAIVAQPDSARVFWSQGDSVLTSSVAPNGRRGSASTVPVKNYAAIAWTGLDTVAAWNEGTTGDNRIMAAFIDDDGNATSPAILVQSPTLIGVDALSCNDNDCALAWRQYDENNGNPEHFFQRFTNSGAMLGEPLPLPSGVTQLSGRANEYLLLFRWAGLFASRYADGKLSDVTDLQIDTGNVTIASKPDGWLIGAASSIIRLDSNAAIQWRNTLPADTQTSTTWDGHYWITAWTWDNDIHASRINDDGTIKDNFLVAATSGAKSNPVLRSNGNGLTALAYSRWTDDALYGITSRVFIRWIDSR